MGYPKSEACGDLHPYFRKNDSRPRLILFGRFDQRDTHCPKVLQAGRRKHDKIALTQMSWKSNQTGLASMKLTRHIIFNSVLTCILLAVASSLQAQQVTGTPGSPSATTSN